MVKRIVGLIYIIIIGVLIAIEFKFDIKGLDIVALFLTAGFVLFTFEIKLDEDSKK